MQTSQLLSVSNLATKCGKDLESVMTCLSFAQEKQSSPSKECCASTKNTKDKVPECLCASAPHCLPPTECQRQQPLNSLLLLLHFEMKL
ncbi:unnamed protein product [Linum trigynum]|uniref:Bifunctional inhibitor/plant lipid transfer protein/seed storage helical domain-containing protein n=1 Tax=Linum trigynum TaxID=586398 RepID=A0AAV2CER6_9ROSI